MQDAHNLFDFHVEEKFVQILFDFCPEENLPFSQDMVKFTEQELDIWFMLNDDFYKENNAENFTTNGAVQSRYIRNKININLYNWLGLQWEFES